MKTLPLSNKFKMAQLRRLAGMSLSNNAVEEPIPVKKEEIKIKSIEVDNIENFNCPYCEKSYKDFREKKRPDSSIRLHLRHCKKRHDKQK